MLGKKEFEESKNRAYEEGYLIGVAWGLSIVACMGWIGVGIQKYRAKQA